MTRRLCAFGLLVALLILSTSPAFAQYRNRGVVVTDYYMDDNRLYVTVEIYEDCESGSFTLNIHYTDFGHSKQASRTGSWYGGASSDTMTVTLTSDSTVNSVTVSSVRPDC